MALKKQGKNSGEIQAEKKDGQEALFPHGNSIFNYNSRYHYNVEWNFRVTIFFQG